MTAISRDLELEIWDGMVPVIVTLHRDEVTALEAPEPFYTSVPRVTFLSAVSNEIIEHFAPSAPMGGGNNSVWFDADGSPLDWQLPMGVAFDLHQPQTLPWPLVVHFTSFPDKVLVRGGGAEQHFYHSLKQGLFLEHGNSSTAMTLPKDEQSQLWAALQQHEPLSFCKINRRLKCERPMMIPTRFVKLDEPCAQIPVPVASPDGEPTTLGTVLEGLLPGATPSSYHACCHGVRLELDTPVVELWRACCFPDHWCYVTIHDASER